MGYDLYNAEDHFRFNVSEWPRLLQIAENAGWEPAGTSPPVFDDPGMNAGYAYWDGNYTDNAMQTVSAEDARALAEALESALDDIPERNIHIRRLDSPLYETFSYSGDKAYLRRFIRFCRAGSFSIH